MREPAFGYCPICGVPLWDSQYDHKCSKRKTAAIDRAHAAADIEPSGRTSPDSYATRLREGFRMIDGEAPVVANTIVVLDDPL